MQWSSLARNLERDQISTDAPHFANFTLLEVYIKKFYTFCDLALTSSSILQPVMTCLCNP